MSLHSAQPKREELASYNLKQSRELIQTTIIVKDSYPMTREYQAFLILSGALPTSPEVIKS